MSWQVTGTQKFPAVIGEPFGGGFFAGYISHTADGSPTHALIVAPRETGATGSGYTLTTNLAWKSPASATTGTTSVYDGLANTTAMVTAGISDHPAAQFCVNLSIGGFTDWYLPARLELDIAYFNLKPGTSSSNTAFGVNDYSVPKRIANYSIDYPGQTYVSAFNTSSESFVNAQHRSSTQTTAGSATTVSFDNGAQSSFAKANLTNVRAFRRIAL
jgi:hypothetical protein